MSQGEKSGPPDRHGPAVIIDRIERRIVTLRGQRVMIDADLAELYGVSTRVLNQAVKRNRERFPSDFVFRLKASEAGMNRSQIVIGSQKHRDPRYRPLAFTEHGAIMAANVLNSARAMSVSVLVVRAFVRLRQLLATHRELADKLAELERRLGGHDEAIRTLMTAIRDLMEPKPEPRRERIGFKPAIGKPRLQLQGLRPGRDRRGRPASRPRGPAASPRSGA